MRVTITTCGTSTLTNGANAEEFKFLRSNANKRKEQYTPEAWARIQKIANERRARILSADEEEARKCSAELNGFAGYYRRSGNLEDAVKDTHWLIHTDTYQGQIAAELLRDWGATRGINLTPIQIDDLNTASIEEFRMGINNLVDWCVGALPGYRAQGYDVIFNLVGGFKSLQGYMQTLGMFYADETIYIFETGSELLSIPRLPVDFAAQAKQSVIDHFDAFRRMQREDLPRAECAGIPETLLYIVDGKCSLSEWGRVIWGECQKEAYSREILPPASPHIVISDKVKKQGESLEPDRIMRLNQALDKLSRHLETKGKENLRSCDLRKLTSDPVPPSTYEFNLWPDMGGWRGFCHWEEDRLIVDSIDMGLGHS